jgi:hypothetical protein
LPFPLRCVYSLETNFSPQPLSLLLKLNPRVTELSCYDVAPVTPGELARTHARESRRRRCLRGGRLGVVSQLACAHSRASPPSHPPYSLTFPLLLERQVSLPTSPTAPPPPRLPATLAMTSSRPSPAARCGYSLRRHLHQPASSQTTTIHCPRRPNFSCFALHLLPALPARPI